MAPVTAPSRGLFDPVQIGAVTTRNRICVPPMVLYGHAAEDGMVTDVHVRHYEALAQGGAGLIIQEATCVLKNGRLREDQLGIWEDGHIPGLRRIVEAVHQRGCPIFLQIHHAGVVGIGPEHLCPDRYCFHGKNGDVLGQKMTPADIEAVKAAFIAAGRRAYLAGYDGVELHGCHSYLLCQFLNRRVNQREDRYGRRPVELVTEIVEGIQQVTDPSFVIGIRLGGFEPTLADGIDHARYLADHSIAFIDVSYGFAGEMDTTAPGNPELPDTVRAADAIRRAVNIPVFAVGHIRLPEDAERVLRETEVDMVDVGRSILVDPSWANRARHGQKPGKCLDCRVCQWRVDAAKCPGRIQQRQTDQNPAPHDCK